MTARRRRLVFAILGLATAMAAGGPVAQAQTSSTLPLIAILEPGPASPPSPALAWMRDALAKHDWVEGRTARFQTRYGDWQPDRMATMVRELIALKPDVIYTHSTVAVQWWPRSPPPSPSSSSPPAILLIWMWSGAWHSPAETSPA